MKRLPLFLLLIFLLAGCAGPAAPVARLASPTTLTVPVTAAPRGYMTFVINVHDWVHAGESADTLEDVYEPYLIQAGFLKRTTRGRMVTEKAFSHLNIALTNEDQRLLF